MQQQRNGFARFVVDPVEGLGGRLPRPGIENIPQRLLGTKKRIPIAVVQSIVLKERLDFRNQSMLFGAFFPSPGADSFQL
jgi:hypothetical protein